MVIRSERDEVLEIIHKLFWYTDQRSWDLLQAEVFSDLVFMDMSSMQGPSEEMRAADICKIWESDFAGIDVVHHASSNHLVDIQDHTATVLLYGTATHYKASAANGQTRQFTGTYDIRLMKHGFGWRIYEFTFRLQFQTGNLSLV
ncbi:MAG TPA: hypothetical protein DHV17_05100 [Chitinophagaceae bacterium]|nr:hypothetical protein [Chitinophagaceae bacterium]HRF27805.1 nuclear transport factor 2 family protein [Ferruginibacter sp.]